MSDLTREWLRRSAALALESTESYTYSDFLEERIAELEAQINEAKSRCQEIITESSRRQGNIIWIQDALGGVNND